jgi:hypothetical protein
MKAIKRTLMKVKAIECDKSAVTIVFSNSCVEFRAMVYRVMIKPVPGLNSVVVSSSGTLPNFEKVSNRNKKIG